MSQRALDMLKHYKDKGERVDEVLYQTILTEFERLSGNIKMTQPIKVLKVDPDIRVTDSFLSELEDSLVGQWCVPENMIVVNNIDSVKTNTEELKEYLIYLQGILNDCNIPEIQKTEINKEWSKLAKELSILQKPKMIIKNDSLQE